MASTKPPNPAEVCPQLDGEGALQYQAFLDYALLGPVRSVSRLMLFYRERDSQMSPATTTRLASLKKWCGKFRWVERCEEWDRVAGPARVAYLVSERHQMEADLALERDRWANQRRDVRREFLEAVEKEFVGILDKGDLGLRGIRSFLESLKLHADLCEAIEIYPSLKSGNKLLDAIALLVEHKVLPPDRKEQWMREISESMNRLSAPPCPPSPPSAP